jgi:hypothetical protein
LLREPQRQTENSLLISLFLENLVVVGYFRAVPLGAALIFVG